MPNQDHGGEFHASLQRFSAGASEFDKGLGVYYTIIMIRRPKTPILIF